MIKKNTVFILGAGASAAAPFKYPIGSDLRDEICKNLKGETKLTHSLAQALTTEKIDLSDHVKAVLGFRDCFYRSSEFTIDAFIKNQYKLYGTIAKFAIAQALLKYENEELLHSDPKINWYMQLYQLMKTDPPENFYQNKVSFITFNYDLSLDQFLYNSLSNSCAVLKNKEDVKKILEKIPIIHLHGQLGKLSWQGEETGRSYGDGNLTNHEFKVIANSILTAFDEIDFEKDHRFIKALERIREAEKICFIGFGFDESNLQRLPVASMKGKNVIGTCYGLSESKKAYAEKYFKDLAENNITWAPIDASEFVLKTIL